MISIRKAADRGRARFGWLVLAMAPGCFSGVAAMFVLGRIAPQLHLPWRPPDSAARVLLHDLVWLVGVPVVALGALVDAVAARLLRGDDMSNTYRVLARKRD